jgi:hypothetical protein
VPSAWSSVVLAAWGLSLVGGVGVVIGLVGMVGVLHTVICWFLHGSVSHQRGPPPLGGGCIFLAPNAFGIGSFGLLSK